MSRTLFLIHGMWCGAWCWDEYRGVFEQHGYDVIAPNLRHHEPRAQPPPAELGSVGLLDYAADLEDRIRRMDERPVLIGHSMGGLLVQMLAARGLGAAAVCLAPAPPTGILALRRPSVFVAFAGGIPQIVARRPMRPSYTAARYAIFNGLPQEEARRLYDRCVPESGRAISEIGLRTFRAVIPYVDPDRASEVDPRMVACPMLVVGARRDRITPLPIAGKVAARYGAEYVRFDDQAHWLLSGPGWRGVAECVLQWLESRTAHPFERGN